MTYSFGAYEASLAIWNGSIALTAAGISLAMLDWVAGWGLVRIGLVLPQALSASRARAGTVKAARRARARVARREVVHLVGHCAPGMGCMSMCVVHKD